MKHSTGNGFCGISHTYPGNRGTSKGRSSMSANPIKPARSIGKRISSRKISVPLLSSSERHTLSDTKVERLHENIRIVPMAEANVESIRDCLDTVAREL